jgi:hypothetical protein
VRSCNGRAEIRGWCIKHAEMHADRLFSRYVRDRDGVCTGAAVLNGECRGILQAAHVVGRRNYAVRFSPMNCWSLCQGHHMVVDQHGFEHAKHIWAGVNLLAAGTTYDELMSQAAIITKRRTATEEALDWLHAACPGGTKE